MAERPQKLNVKEQESHRLQNLHMNIKTCVDRTCYVPTVPLILKFCLLYVVHPLVLLGLTMSPIMLCSIVVSFPTSSVRKLLGCPFTFAAIGSVSKPVKVHGETCLIWQTPKRFHYISH